MKDHVILRALVEEWLAKALISDFPGVEDEMKEVEKQIRDLFHVTLQEAIEMV